MQAVVAANLTELAACANANVFKSVVNREGKLVSSGEETVHQMLTMAKAIIERYVALATDIGGKKSTSLSGLKYSGLDVTQYLTDSLFYQNMHL